MLLGTWLYFPYLFICQGIPRPGNSEVTFSVFNQSANTSLTIQKIEEIPLSALSMDKINELVDLSSNYPFNAERQAENLVNIKF